MVSALEAAHQAGRFIVTSSLKHNAETGRICEGLDFGLVKLKRKTAVHFRADDLAGSSVLNNARRCDGHG